MKFSLLLVLFSLLPGCTSRAKPSPQVEAFLKLNEEHSEKHAACTLQNKKVFTQAITERTNPQTGDVEFIFVRDEFKALEFLEKVDLKELTLRENELEYDILISDCGESSIERPVCDTIWPSMKFYKGLMHAVAHNKWTAEANTKAIEKIRSYITVIGESRATLTNLHIAVELLRQLSVLGHAPKSVERESDILKKEMDSVHYGISKQRKIAAGKSSECEVVQELHKIERQAIERFSEKLLSLLRN